MRHEEREPSGWRVSDGRPEPAQLAAVMEPIVETVDPEMVIVFGSAARATMTAESDVDLVVVKDVSDLEAMKARAAVCLPTGHPPVHIVPATRRLLNDLRDSPSWIYGPAMAEGIVAYERGGGARGWSTRAWDRIAIPESPGERMVPFAMFEATAEAREREARVISAAPSTVGINMHPTLPGVFLPAAATALRVDMPTVPAGTAAFPVLNTSLTAAARDKGVAGPETAAAIGVTTVDFKRVTGSFRIALEDIQKLDTIETTLTDNLAAVMSDAADALVVNGVVAVDAVVSAVPGFFSAANPLVTAATAATTAADFAAYVSAMAGAIDGKYARMPQDVSMLCAPEVIADAIATYSTTGPRSAYSELAATFRGVTATDRITPSNTHVSPAIAVRHSVPGRVAVSARWSGMQVIRDPFSDANKGEIILTAIMMMSGAKVLRGDVYKGSGRADPRPRRRNQDRGAGDPGHRVSGAGRPGPNVRRVSRPARTPYPGRRA